MSSETNDDLHKRLLALEDEVKLLKNNSSQTNSFGKKEKKEKKPRAPTQYNNFVSEYINKQREELGENFKHKVAFSEAAKKWKENKNSNEKTSK